MKPTSTQPLGYYLSNKRDAEVFDAIALEFGSRLETFSASDRREALLLLALAVYTDSMHLAIEQFDTSISTLTLPHSFLDLVEHLNREGWLSLTASIVNQLRDQ